MGSSISIAESPCPMSDASSVVLMISITSGVAVAVSSSFVSAMPCGTKTTAATLERRRLRTASHKYRLCCFRCPMATSTRAGIKETFSRITKGDFKQEELLELLYEIAVELGIAAQDLGNKWESFAVNRQLKVMPTLPNLRAFKQGIHARNRTRHLM